MKKYCYIIGDSYFTDYGPSSDKWLTQCFKKFEYRDIEVKNFSYGGTGFDRQWSHVFSLKNEPYFKDIKYCIIGWSNPYRLLDTSMRRDWSLTRLDMMKNNDNHPTYDKKQQALKTLVAEGLLIDPIHYDKAKALLQWTNDHIFNNEEYSHIKFINFYCVYDKQHQILFDNQVTVQPSLYDFVTKKYNMEYNNEPNHFPMFEHHYMSENLHKILQEDKKLWHLI